MVAPANTITEVLNKWAEIGVFAYVLPFLMIFAVVYGVLNKTRLLGTNKPVQALIAFSVGLMALQFDLVPNFFAIIFPYTGMGISVLLVALILMGLLAAESDVDWAKYVWFAIGMIIFITVLLMTLTDSAWLGNKGLALADSWPAILAIIIVLGFMFWIIKTKDVGNEK